MRIPVGRRMSERERRAKPADASPPRRKAGARWVRCSKAPFMHLGGGRDSVTPRTSRRNFPSNESH
jgi:hypothetical protein